MINHSFIAYLGDLSDSKTGGPELNTPINTPLDYHYHSRDPSNHGSALEYISINKVIIHCLWLSQLLKTNLVFLA